MVAYGSTPGVGGLGHSVASAIQFVGGLVPATTVCGPSPGREAAHSADWQALRQRFAADARPRGWRAYFDERLRQGRHVAGRDSRLASWNGEQTADCSPHLVYGFTQVSLPSLEWAARAGVDSVLENPNGHIRDFERVYREQSRVLCRARYFGHPSPEMMRRVEKEYELATYIRVYSQWAKRMMMSYGVAGGKILVAPHAIDIARFSPPRDVRPASGPLRICFVGSLCLRKGFTYLLNAMRRLDGGSLRLRIVGATGDRECASLYKRAVAGLDVTALPGDPLPAYHEAELLVLPSLEDGFGFVVAEAMACGLPVIVTSACGAAEWVTPGETGWIIPPADESALAAALREACAKRTGLPAMGQEARAQVTNFIGRLRESSVVV